MDLFIVQIDILNYYQDGLFGQRYYFLGDRCPTKAEVLEYIQELHNTDSEFPEYIRDHLDALETLENSEFPNISGSCVQRSSQTLYMPFGNTLRQIVVSRINPKRIK